MMTSSPRETILSLFKETPDGYVSGARISKALGVSRTAVWKHISNLRDLGYEIKAVPSRGYQLVRTPDVLLAEELQSGLETRVIGRELRCLAQTDSTNHQACSLADEGAAEGLVVIAETQSSGKGRLGRSWVSPPGVNLYASIVLRPQILPLNASQLTFLSAVAVCRAIRAETGLPATVKWPNDILLHDKKVAGLLNEMSSETDRVKYVVLGIGVNLNMTTEQFPSLLRYPATSLAIEAGAPVSRVAFTRTLLAELDRLYQEYLGSGPGPIFDAWKELCDLTGKVVTVDCQSQIIEGVMLGLDHDGALLVRTAGGVERVLAGDVRPA